MSGRTGTEVEAGTARWERLARAALEQTEAAPDDRSLRQLLAFQVDGASYAVPVESVREIVRIRPITPIPQVPDAVRGVISLRGEIVQVVDARRRLGAPPREPTVSTRIVIVEDAEGNLSGLLVDAVTEVIRVDEEAFRSAGAGDTGAVTSLCAHQGRFVSMLDLPRVLDVDAGR